MEAALADQKQAEQRAKEATDAASIRESDHIKDKALVEATLTSLETQITSLESQLNQRREVTRLSRLQKLE